MIAALLEAITTNYGRNTLGCLVLVPILITCLQYYHRCRLRRDKANCAAVADAMEAILSSQRATREDGDEDKADGALHISTALNPDPHGNSNTDNFGFGHFDETNDNLGFDNYDERDDEEDNFLQEEVVEITLDLGNMEGDVRRFLSRMYRVIM